MANDSVLEKKSDGTTVPSPPIIVPAHKPLSHTAQEISDRIDAELSRKNLLIAAHGGMSPRAAAIKDYPLSMLPPLDPSSPGYAKDLAARLEYDRRNQENEAKRTAIVLQEFTEVYGFLLAISVEAVELRRELQTTCKDYAGHADCFDGPRAFKMVKHHLLHGTEELLKCAYHTLVYLARTRKLGVTYSKHAPNAFKLSALADSNWRHTRSTSGFCIFLAGASISSCCRRQGCIAMSSTEAELVALAECAIELICVRGVLTSLGYEVKGPVEVGTDNTGAYNLCHRFGAAQHSRHIDRKLYKMRELRGAGIVTVKYVPTDDNTADLFTKVLTRQPFEKHRRRVMNLTDK